MNASWHETWYLRKSLENKLRKIDEKSNTKNRDQRTSHYIMRKWYIIYHISEKGLSKNRGGQKA